MIIGRRFGIRRKSTLYFQNMISKLVHDGIKCKEDLSQGKKKK